MITSSTSSPHAGDSRWADSARRMAKRLLHGAYWTLSDFGHVWIGTTALPVPPADESVLQGPPPGHPERLGAPSLTPVERALERQLTR